MPQELDPLTALFLRNLTILSSVVPGQGQQSATSSDVTDFFRKAVNDVAAAGRRQEESIQKYLEALQPSFEKEFADTKLAQAFRRQEDFLAKVSRYSLAQMLLGAASQAAAGIGALGAAFGRNFGAAPFIRQQQDRAYQTFVGGMEGALKAQEQKANLEILKAQAEDEFERNRQQLLMNLLNLNVGLAGLDVQRARELANINVEAAKTAASLQREGLRSGARVTGQIIDAATDLTTAQYKAIQDIAEEAKPKQLKESAYELPSAAFMEGWAKTASAGSYANSALREPAVIRANIVADMASVRDKARIYGPDFRVDVAVERMNAFLDWVRASAGEDVVKKIAKDIEADSKRYLTELGIVFDPDEGYFKIAGAPQGGQPEDIDAGSSQAPTILHGNYGYLTPGQFGPGGLRVNTGE